MLCYINLYKSIINVFFMGYGTFAIETAKEAGKIVMERYHQASELEWKIPTNFRTDADVEIDALIRDRILEAYPTHNIYSEEDADIVKESDFSWVVDPIDGTIPWLRGTTDHFSVCIALAKGKKPVLGVTYAPAREEMYFAVKGNGAYCNGERITTSDQTDINRILLGVDVGKERTNFQRANIAKYFEKAYAPDGVTTCLSSACASVPLALTASGNYDAYMSLGLEPWDMAAGVIINREAGARVTNIKGKEWNLDDSSILVANPTLHKNLLDFFPE